MSSSIWGLASRVVPFALAAVLGAAAGGCAPTRSVAGDLPQDSAPRAGQEAVPPAAVDTPVFVDVTAPAVDASEPAPLAWTEVRGYAWTGESPFMDVALVIDLSASTLIASGDDIDGDGRVGRLRPEANWLFTMGITSFHYNPRLLSSDLGDTVARAELAAARRFVETADLGRTRISILTFSGSARIRIGLSDDREQLLAEIDRLVRLERRRARDFELRGTDTGKALATAGSMLLDAQEPDAPRRREVLVLSDGMPSLPRGRGPKFAVATAIVLEERDVQVHFFPLGAVALRNAPFFEFMDDLAGTSHTKVGRVGEIVERLAETRLDRLSAIEIENRTTGTAGRAPRLFADGAFDALVELAPGPNEIVVRARTREGGVAETVRWVRYEPPDPEDLIGARRAREEAERLVARLRDRRAETELLVEIDQVRESALKQERRLTIQVDTEQAGETDSERRHPDEAGPETTDDR